MRGKTAFRTFEQVWSVLSKDIQVQLYNLVPKNHRTTKIAQAGESNSKKLSLQMQWKQTVVEIGKCIHQLSCSVWTSAPPYPLYQSRKSTTKASVVMKKSTKTLNPAFLRIASRSCSLPSRMDSVLAMVVVFRCDRSISCFRTFSEKASCSLAISVSFWPICLW